MHPCAAVGGRGRVRGREGRCGGGRAGVPMGRGWGGCRGAAAARLVVGEVDELPRHALGAVDLGLRLEHAPEEELLQLLVGVVDAQLLEAVVREALEPEDVEQPDVVLLRQLVGVVLAADEGVDPADEPVEGAGVHRAHEGVAGAAALGGRELLREHRAGARGDQPLGEVVHQLRDAEELLRRAPRRLGLLRHHAVAVGVGVERDGARVEHARQQLHERVRLLGVEPREAERARRLLVRRLVVDAVDRGGAAAAERGEVLGALAVELELLLRRLVGARDELRAEWG